MRALFRTLWSVFGGGSGTYTRSDGIRAARPELATALGMRPQARHSEFLGAVATESIPTKKEVLWIDWGRHLRSETLSRRLDVALEQICCDGGRLWRYLRSVPRTVAAIHDKRPQVVIATNPSIVLGFMLLALRSWYGFRLVSDAHYVGVRAVNNAWLLQRVLDFHNVRVDLVIVTNNEHAAFLSGLGAQTYVCQDPLPDIPQALESVHATIPYTFLICSFDEDEPYEAAFEAFSTLHGEGFSLYVSGEYSKAKTDLARFPWVRLLGFLPIDQYYAYLRAASVVMDLTDMEDCLLCGAYEALAAGKPLVVSKTAALGEYFADAVVLTENTSEAIKESVLSAFAHRDELAQRAQEWVARNHQYMDQRIAGLRALLARSDTKASR